MKRKSIYLFLTICCISMISSARQRYSSCMENAANEVAKAKKAGVKNACNGEAGYDLSPVGFFVLNM